MDLEQHRRKAREAQKAQRKFLDRIKKHPPRDLDRIVMAIDEEIWEEIDCLECANCCKTISPIFTQRDIERIASSMRMKPGKFSEEYLRVDEDGDFVLKNSPCPFLEQDNRCRIYDHRPKACREYPHTGQRNFRQRIAITKKNVLVCPAAYEIVERLRSTISR